jgi:fructoselysine 6-phosphate deglycase
MTNKIQYLNEVKNALGAVKDKKAQQYFFVACGGSMATLQAAQYIFDRESAIPSYIYTSQEFICRTPKGLGENSVVILCSHSGKTSETVEAAKFSKNIGALTIAFSNDITSPLSQAVDYLVSYGWGDEVDASEGLSGQLLRTVFGILNIDNKSDKYERAILAIDQLQDCITTNVEKFDKAALAFADEYKREPLFYTMASGICYPEAYALTACFLMEMQWIHSGCIHSGEFFHGPLEITDYDVAFILLKSIGDTRMIDERAHKFIERYSKKVIVIDALEFDMDGIDKDLHEYLQQAVMTAVVKRYIDYLAEARGHLLKVRRYMGKTSY